MVGDTQFVHGADKLARRIATIREKLSLPKLIPEIGDLLYKRTMDRFRRMEDPDGNPWLALAPSTLRRKAAEGFGDQPSLVRKGYLRDSIQLIRGSIANATFINTGAGVRIGVTDPGVALYGRVQNKGNHHVPKRRFLGIGRLDIKAVDSLLRRQATNL